MIQRLEPRSVSRGVIGVLDVGTNKICCLMVAPDAGGQPALIGIGHQRSQGLKSGMIVEAEAAETAVRAAIRQAERMAGIALERVHLAVACGRIRSASFLARGAIGDGIVGDPDLDRLLAGGEAYLARSGRMVIQLTRSDWRLDGVDGVRDPRGMAGHEIAVELQGVAADEGSVRNLLSVVERCHIEVEGLVAAPYASGLAVATEEERQTGVLIVDIGAGVTTLAGFLENRLTFVDAIPVGGQHVTFDIARGLATTLVEAERIKTLYGTLVKAASDHSELISYPIVDDGETSIYQTSRAKVREIIEPRVAGLQQLIAERLALQGLGDLATGRVILTGGASQLLGFDQAWSEQFGGIARIGRPKPIGRMPGSMCSPAFSTVIGLTNSARSSAGDRLSHFRSPDGERSYLRQVGRWFSHNF